jgi:hypothetical protein
MGNRFVLRFENWTGLPFWFVVLSAVYAMKDLSLKYIVIPSVEDKMSGENLRQGQGVLDQLLADTHDRRRYLLLEIKHSES